MTVLCRPGSCTKAQKDGIKHSGPRVSLTSFTTSWKQFSSISAFGRSSLNLLLATRNELWSRLTCDTVRCDRNGARRTVIPFTSDDLMISLDTRFDP